MATKSLSVADILTAGVTAVIAVATIIPFSAVAVLVFLAATFVSARSRIRVGRTRFALTNLVAATATFCVIIVGAALYTPTKRVQQQLNRRIYLPTTTITLAELSYAAVFQRESFPIRTSFCFADDEKELVIKWPKRDLTLGEFLDAIESQSTLRRRFMHCGSGYTVLGGGDCCLGLYIRDPELAVPPYPRDRFDVDAYAAVRPLEFNALNRSGEQGDN